MKDLNQWKSVCGNIKTIVDKRLAHFESVDEATIPKATFNDLDTAIDTVGEYIGKYTLLFTATSIVEMEPVIQGDWKRPFRKALFAD
jgi:hypothetical protein